jgi:hypothetical protein
VGWRTLIRFSERKNSIIESNIDYKKESEVIMAYSDKVVDHYNNPRNVGSLDKKASNVGTGLVGAPECGK